MKKTVILLVLTAVSAVNYGQIIANHTVVDQYDDIPQYYMNEVKKMLFVIAGESHSRAYTNGLATLETQNANYAVNYSNPPETPTSSYLRTTNAVWGDLNNATGWQNWIGEEDWYTSSSAISQIKTGITYCHNNNREISAIGFGWCYDEGMTSSKPYLEATQQYIDYCSSNGYKTKVYFTTGPVDDFLTSGGSGYRKSLLYDSIRNYVKADPSRLLFDYADILCYDNGSNTPNSATWNGHTFPIITSTNDTPDGSAHISSAGELRLAKAIWWMLARMAGWDGSTANIQVTRITVTGAGGATTISSDNGTLQLSAAITPSNASNKNVTWSLQNGNGTIATISSTGLVKALTNGSVTAKATATDGSGVTGTLTITITNQIVTGIPEDRNDESVSLRNTGSQLIIDYTNISDFQNIQVYDILGHVILNRKLPEDEYHLDLSDMISGIYLIVLSGRNLSRTFKISCP